MNHYLECRMQILWTLFGGHHKTRLFLGSFLCIYRSFLSSMYRTGIFFVGCLFVVVVVVLFFGAVFFFFFFFFFFFIWGGGGGG